MSNREIKQVIKLDGEQAYNQAIREAQRNLRTLKSELKAETAELGANASAQQKAETRAKSLRQQIAEQEKIVAALRGALDEVRQKYGDNADEVARWETRLNNARTSLATMRNELENTGGGLQNVKTEAAAATVATKSVGDALGDLSRVGESVAGAIEDIFRGMISAVKEAVGELWGMITDTAARANNWTDLGNYYGSTAQEIQMWNRSIEAAGGNFQDFMGIVNQVAFGGKENKITEWLGISKENYQDDVQYALAVLDELEQRRKTWDRETYDAAMNDIFGTKRSQSVSWFLANAHGHEGPEGTWINGWRDNPERFNGDESAFGMDSETLGTMNDLYLMVASIETKWNALKDNVAGGLGTMVLPLLVNVEGALDGLAEYMNAEDDASREAALAKIRKNMEEFFHKLGEIIRECIGILREVGEELRQSDDPVTRTIGEILGALADALQWITEHAEDVKKAFEIIFGVWLIAKLGAIALKLASIITQIELIKAFSLTGAAGGGAELAAVAGTGATGAISTLTGGVAGVAGYAAYTWLMVELKKSLMQDYEYNRELEQGRYSDEELGWMQEYSAAVSAANAGFEGKEQLTPEEERIRSQRMDAAMMQLMSHFASPEDFIDYWNFEDSERGSVNLWLDMMKDASRGYSPWMWQMMSRTWGEETMQDLFSTHYNDADWLSAYTESFGRYSGAGGDAMQYGYGPTSYAAAGLLGHMAPYMDNPELWGQQETEADRSLMEAAQLLYDTAQEMHGGGSFWENASWLNSELWRNAGQQDGITGADLQGFRSLPGQLQAAARSGVAAGVSGIQVNLDGYRVGSLVAPYVSEMIARDMV